MKWALALLAVVGGILGGAHHLGAPAPDPGGIDPVSGPGMAAGVSGLETDLRILAFLQAYGPLVQGVTFTDQDAVFTVGGQAIYFQEGRMLGEGSLGEADRFDSFFYAYPIEAFGAPPPPEYTPTRSTDLIEALFGRSESEIRRGCERVTFLGRRLFVNAVAVDPLQAVEREIVAAARRDGDVARWIEELEIAFSFQDKEIAGSQSRSYHAWGLAVDLVPRSYAGKQVYWRWSRVFNREGWYRIPLSERWSPPRAVIDAFERHGFVWGGKWTYFDTIHFEYRPEILLYNRLLAG